MIIVADSSPLLSFAILDKLDIIEQIFDKLYVPTAVFNELTLLNKPYSNKLKDFLTNKVISVKNIDLVKVLSNEIDLGEAEAIALALERHIPDILIDDLKGRKIASFNGLFPIGTIGGLLYAKKKKLINEIKPFLDILIENDIRIGKSLYKKAISLASENKL
ncbi:MAG: DUF3368 domain-containing protein [Candidatus Cloacimonetes bacterium]|nr:DUF3368 domain-containing protein [Candidatus Cloacimonadota bacterium]